MAAISPSKRAGNGHAEAIRPAAFETGRATLADTITYWFVMGSIYLGFGFLWYYPAKSKLFDQDGNMPAAVKESFDGKFFDSFPGLDASWLLLGILEAVIVLGFVASLIRREFMPANAKPVLFGTLGFSLIVFATLIFGERMAGEHETVANLAGYFGTTVVVMILLLLLPPYRPTHWLSSLTRGQPPR